MKKDAKAVIPKPEGRGLLAIEKGKQPDVLPKSGPGSSSKSTASKRTDRKRPKQEADVLYLSNTTSEPCTSTHCSPFAETSSNSTEASEISNEASKKSNETSKKPVEKEKNPVPSNESKTAEASKKRKQTPKKPRQPSKCPYCPVVMTRTNDLRKHVVSSFVSLTKLSPSNNTNQHGLTFIFPYPRSISNRKSFIRGHTRCFVTCATSDAVILLPTSLMRTITYASARTAATLLRITAVYPATKHSVG